VLKFNRETRQTFPLIQVRQVFRVSGPAAPGRKESSESVISSEKTQHAARSGQRLAALPCFAPREDQESSDQLSINSSKTITTCHFLAVAFQFINNQPFKIKHFPLAFSSLPLHDSRSLSCKQRPARFVTRKQQRNLLCAESLVSGQVLTLRPKTVYLLLSGDGEASLIRTLQEPGKSKAKVSKRLQATTCSLHPFVIFLPHILIRSSPLIFQSGTVPFTLLLRRDTTC
jgi:hypothetical protein